MKRRILKLELKRAVEILQSVKWKFFEVKDGYVEIDHPVGGSESYIIRLPFDSEKKKQEIRSELLASGFTEQEIEYAPDLS